MKDFDPNSAADKDSGIFGLPFTEDEASLIYLPVPWEATTSYGGGTSNGPSAIFEASRQVDLYDLDVIKPYEAGLYWAAEPENVRVWNDEAKAVAQLIIEEGGNIEGKPHLKKDLDLVNRFSEKVNEAVYSETKRFIAAKKIVGLVGGDHAAPFGALKAAGEAYGKFGVLHFDAHSDTRIAYEGFLWSHASIMHNVLEKIPQVEKLVQVGIRDFCEQELDYCKAQGERVKIFFDADLSRMKYEGKSWKNISEAVVKELPEKVWISFDIDGLDPRFCPNTGTPVPGGMDFNEANYIIQTLVTSGRTIVGFDLNEVAPDETADNEWDANVGARLLYKLTAWTLASQGKRQRRS
jgi:agmatinase